MAFEGLEMIEATSLPYFTPDRVEEAKADEKGSEGTGLKSISAVYAELLLALRG